MQDDEALDNAFKIALATGQPCYILHTDGVMRDETGRFPDRMGDPEKNRRYLDQKRKEEVLLDAMSYRIEADTLRKEGHKVSVLDDCIIIWPRGTSRNK